MGRLTDEESRQIQDALRAQVDRLGYLAQQLDGAEHGPYARWNHALRELAATLGVAAKEIGALRAGGALTVEFSESLPRGDAEWDDLTEESRVALAPAVARPGRKVRYELRLVRADRVRWTPPGHSVVLTADLNIADDLTGPTAVIAAPAEGGWDVALATGPAARWLRDGSGLQPVEEHGRPPGLELETGWTTSKLALAIWQAAIEAALRNGR